MSVGQLVEAYNFLCDRGVFGDEITIETVSRLNHMHRRGWVYTACLGERILAAAGAFRILAWENRFQTELPDREEGDILFISFFASAAQNAAVPLRLLKQFLKRNPDIREIIYWKKLGSTHNPRLKIFRRNRCNSWKNYPEKMAGLLKAPQRIRIQLPDLHSI